MLRNLASVEQSLLLDQLADYTARYTRFLVKGGKQVDLNDCEQVIQQLQTEIQKRKKNIQMASVSYRDDRKYLH